MTYRHDRILDKSMYQTRMILGSLVQFARMVSIRVVCETRDFSYDIRGFLFNQSACFVKHRVTLVNAGSLSSISSLKRPPACERWVTLEAVRVSQPKSPLCHDETKFKGFELNSLQSRTDDEMRQN